jgi:glycerol kinase
VAGRAVVRPVVTETTALGAAYAAGLAVGFWRDLAELKAQWRADRTWQPQMPREEASRRVAAWDRAVQKSLP